jgi:uncharacterized RDD family membrane protein YckC
MLDTDVAIETPEHIVFRYRIAGPMRRCLASVIDLLACYGAFFGIAIVVLVAVSGGHAVGEKVSAAMGAGIGLLMLILFFIQWIYFVIWEAWRGTTLGKMALGLRVMTTTGRPIGFTAAVLRNLLRAADVLPMANVTGLIAMLISPKFQRIGDLVAGTIVVVTERARATTALRLWPPAEPYELAALPEEVVLDAEERTALELFLRRRGTLGAARERELAEIVVSTLSERHAFRVNDPARTLALLYDRAANAGRGEAPPSSRGPASWR